MTEPNLGTTALHFDRTDQAEEYAKRLAASDRLLEIGGLWFGVKRVESSVTQVSIVLQHITGVGP